MYCVGVLAFAREPEPKFSPKNEKELRDAYGLYCHILHQKSEEA